MSIINIMPATNSSIQRLIAEFSALLKEIPELRYVGDPVLRETAKPVTIEEGIAVGTRLGNVMLRYRKIAGYGRGLAAPQIGESKAVFVTFVDGALHTFINPHIHERSHHSNFYRELCLSSGIMSVDVERPEWILIEWVSEDGKKHKEKVEGFLARLYQHEEAHLRGIINLDEARSGGIELATLDPLKEQLRKQ